MVKQARLPILEPRRRGFRTIVEKTNKKAKKVSSAAYRKKNKSKTTH